MLASLSIPQQTQDHLRGIIDGYTARGAQGLPGVLYFATRNHGTPIFEHASGLRGIDSSKPMSLDTTFWLASFTKLVTSIACMQLVEQGTLSLDDADQVEALAPELREVQVLKEAAGGRYELVEKNSRITLRMLLTHTGMSHTSEPQISVQDDKADTIFPRQRASDMHLKTTAWPNSADLLVWTTSRETLQTY